MLKQLHAIKPPLWGSRARPGHSVMSKALWHALATLDPMQHKWNHWETWGPGQFCFWFSTVWRRVLHDIWRGRSGRTSSKFMNTRPTRPRLCCQPPSKMMQNVSLGFQRTWATITRWKPVVPANPNIFRNSGSIWFWIGNGLQNFEDKHHQINIESFNCSARLTVQETLKLKSEIDLNSSLRSTSSYSLFTCGSRSMTCHKTGVEIKPWSFLAEISRAFPAESALL